jgi:cytochrome c biogenesis protein CcmG/thiol:disulfide interchange protein DsbE
MRIFAQVTAVLVVLGLVALFAVSLMNNASGQLQSGSAPDVLLTQFDGNSYRLSSLRGKVIVLNIWASWCEPCKDEAPGLERAWKDYRDRGVVFFGSDYVDTDAPALAFIKQFNITYPNGPDLGSTIYRSFRARGVPETYVIDQRGEIAKTYVGPVKESELRALLSDLLAGAGN